MALNFLVFWYASSSISYLAFNFPALAWYDCWSASERSLHIPPISRNTSVAFMSGFSLTTSSRTAFTKIMYPLSGRLGAFGSFLKGFFAALALYSARTFWYFLKLLLALYFSIFFT